LVALVVAIGQEKTAETALKVSIPRPDAPNPSAGARVGFALGWASAGKWDQALQLANAPGPPSERWNALLAVATLAAEKNPEETRKAVESAMTILDKEMEGQRPDSWSLWRLASVGARVGLAERVKPVAEAIPEAGLRSRAHLEVTRFQLAGSDQSDMAALSAAAKDDSQPQLLGLRARHTARYGNAADVLSAIDAWQPESLRPFGYIAVALGLQDVGQ
jgi:hypothetical protein